MCLLLEGSAHSPRVCPVVVVVAVVVAVGCPAWRVSL